MGPRIADRAGRNHERSLHWCVPRRVQRSLRRENGVRLGAGAAVGGSVHYCPAKEPPMPPTLKYLFRNTNRATGGIIAMTATAMTAPQSVVFCWKND